MCKGISAERHLSMKPPQDEIYHSVKLVRSMEVDQVDWSEVEGGPTRGADRY